MLVDTGLYAHVRHPLYLGILPFVAGLSLWLESYVSLIATTGILIILIARIVVEEKTLRKTLPGYMEYIDKYRTGLYHLSGSNMQRSQAVKFLAQQLDSLDGE